MKTVNYVLPIYWAPALVNGDFGGLDDNDKNAIAVFCGYLRSEHGSDYCLACGDSEGISRRHDASPICDAYNIKTFISEVTEFTFEDRTSI